MTRAPRCPECLGLLVHAEALGYAGSATLQELLYALTTGDAYTASHRASLDKPVAHLTCVICELPIYS